MLPQMFPGTLPRAVRPAIVPANQGSLSPNHLPTLSRLNSPASQARNQAAVLASRAAEASQVRIAPPYRASGSGWSERNATERVGFQVAGNRGLCNGVLHARRADRSNVHKI